MIITNHLRERYLERTKKKYFHLKNCENRCNYCIDLVYSLKEEITAKRESLDNEITSLLQEGEEIKYKNTDLSFLKRTYERHGENTVTRFVYSNGLIFVNIICPERGKVGLTCFSAKDSIFRDFLLRPKYRKQKI